MSVLEQERLSTQPAAVEDDPAGAPRRTPLQWIRFGWRRLTSMRTALQLLFLLSLAAIPGGLLPQRGQEPARVATYLSTHSTLGPLLDRASLFDVFAAPWFAAIYLLLFTSLIGCLGPRIRLHARALRRQPPAVPVRLQRLPAYASWETPAPADQVTATATGLLGRWRRRLQEGGVSAERGYLRETGNLVFHVSLVVLLAGVALGSVLGYESDTVVVEGHGYTNTPSQLNQFRPGRLVTGADLPPWTFHLDDFAATYVEGNVPSTYDAHATFTPAGGTARAVDVRVNHPLSLGSGAKLYLLNHGYAPSFTLSRPGSTTRPSGPVVCSPVQPQTLLSACVVQFRDLPRTAAGVKQDLGFEVQFAPTEVLDPASGRIASQSPALGNPGALVTPYVGDLGSGGVLDNSLDLSRLRPVLDAKGDRRFDNLVVRSTDGRQLASGLPGGWTLQIATVVPDWASFQVKRDPAKPLVLLAAVGIIGGLLLSLRVRRRRLWLRATPVGQPGPAGRTLVEVGGLARSDADASRVEFDQIVDRLRETHPPLEPQETA